MDNKYNSIKAKFEKFKLEAGAIRKRFDIFYEGKMLTQTQYGNAVYTNHLDNAKSRKINMYKAWRLQKNKSNYYILKWEDELIDKIKGEN
jgi:hypothetical protein